MTFFEIKQNFTNWWIYIDIEPNQSYEVTVTVRNISKKVRRIKFVKPKTSKFNLDYEPQGPVAAGLAIKMNVSFETD